MRKSVFFITSSRMHVVEVFGALSRFRHCRFLVADAEDADRLSSQKFLFSIANQSASTFMRKGAFHIFSSRSQV